MTEHQLRGLIAKAVAVNAELLAALNGVYEPEAPAAKMPEPEPEPAQPVRQTVQRHKRPPPVNKNRKLTANEKRTARMALHRATFVAGAPIELTRALSVVHQNYSIWKTNGRVPPRQAEKIEELTGIPKEQLCPDYNEVKQRNGVRHDGTPAQEAGAQLS